MSKDKSGVCNGYKGPQRMSGSYSEIVTRFQVSSKYTIRVTKFTLHLTKNNFIVMLVGKIHGVKFKLQSKMWRYDLTIDLKHDKWYRINYGRWVPGIKI